MGLINWLFGKKEEVKEEPVEEPMEEQPSTPTGLICNYCQEEIFQHEKRKKINNMKFHKKCYKKVLKQSGIQLT